MPEGMRNLGASCLRYSAQTYAFSLLVTSHFPYGAPVLRERASDPDLPMLWGPAPGDAF
jgi:hypothetical protein